ncbi:hypothetical protein JY651_06840 [Pyxidicoccus parkwayensis]|uniref:Lipoprotein n=1 Tax=Pyxidicoccus parkwayensis TaxID=2813578 RepID=A0ABX7P0Q5_9BACT|nr:ELWxxDGT repeat protein [Pyxidicoccus parkwaysis]QSQ24659.1 hypothetical protein JY651_06840 [Pyxidicoccus parkwaysis]
MKSSRGILPVLLFVLSGWVVACAQAPEDGVEVVETSPARESRVDVGTATAQALVPGSRWDVCEDSARRVRGIALQGGSKQEELIALNGRLLFTASDSGHGQELWMSDGPGKPTSLLKDIRPGPPSSSPAQLTVVGRWAYFVADDDEHGAELWRTDGTETGTELVKDIRPGQGPSAPEQLTVVDGTLYFTAYEEVHGRELWRVDGAKKGAELVRDFVAGPAPSASSPLGLRNLTAWGDGLALAVSREDSFEVVLWNVDRRGQARPLFTLEFGLFLEMEAVGRQLFFTVNPGTDETDLWVTRDEPGTATWLRHFPGQTPTSLTAMGDAVYFAAGGEGDWGDWGDPVHGSELWTSDGTVSGTRMVRDIAPGTDSAFIPGQDPFFTVVDGTMYFAASDVAHGRELWRSDGTPSGTWMVRDIEPGEGDSSPWFLRAESGTVFFAATTSGRGQEVWYSGGKSWTTQSLADLAQGAASSSPRGFVRSGFDVYFMATDETGAPGLWSVPFRPAMSCGARAY